MASWVDQLTTFNPYIKTIDTNGFTNSLIYKQQQYDSNVNKINSYIESLHGFPIARDVDKQYLNSKINNLTGSINKYLSNADFSNNSLASQVGSYAGQIANDKYVQNAISNTQRLQNDLTTLNSAKKDNKGYSPANEYHLMKQVNSYMQGGLDDNYQSDGYIPYVNTDEEISKSWKDIHPDSQLVKSVKQDGTSGWWIKTTQGIKQLSQQQVMSEIEATMDPRIRKQLSIDGEYKLQGIDPHSYIDSTFKDDEDSLNNTKNSLTIQIAQNQSNPTQLALLNSQLAGTQKEIDNASAQKTLLKAAADKNPDAIKDQMYYQNWLRGMSNKIAYTDVTSDYDIYKDYYDVMDKFYARLEAANKSSKKGKSDTGDTMFGGVLQDVPVASDQLKDKTLDDVKAQIINTKAARDAEWNGLMSNLINGIYSSAGLSPLSKEHVEANSYYYDDKGNPITETGYNALPPQIQAKYTKGNVVANNIMQDGVATPVYTVKDKKLLDASYRQFYKDYKEGNNVPLEIKQFFDKHEGDIVEDAANAQMLATIQTASDKFYNTTPQLQAFRAAKANISDSELAAFDRAYKKAQAFTNLPGQGLSNPNLNQYINAFGREQGLTQDRIDFIKNFVNSQGAARSVVKNFENGLVRQYQGLFNQREQILDLGKTEDLRAAGQIINATAGKLATGDLKLTGVDLNEVQKAITGDNRDKSAVVYGQEADGSPYLSVTNPSLNKGKPVKIPIDYSTANSTGLYQTDPLAQAKRIMISKGGTTMGNNPTDFLPVPSQATGKYKVGYSLTKMPSGQYKVYLNFGSPDLPSPVSYADNTRGYSEAEVADLLQNQLSEGSIQNYLQSYSTNPNVTPYGGLQGNLNPFQGIGQNNFNFPPPPQLNQFNGRQ